jgi:FixJ family two-component response regulator
MRSTGMAISDPFIAIIDDDASLCTALVGLVRSLGYRATGYGSAEEYLAADNARETAAIVTDIQMPGLSGIELKQRLSQDGVPAPVIMITARTEQGLRDRALASGAVCVLQKPFAAEALIACLEKALAA